MAHKLELEQWQQAAAMFDSGRLYESLDIFRSIADAAKIHFNMGHIYTILEDYDEAIRCFDAAIKLDQYFALAYFQRGVAYMVKEDYASALEDFNDALLYLRRNMLIDYTQLGLRFKLFACDVLYNRALCNYCRGEPEEADKDLKAAYGEQREKRHEMVEQAIKSKGKGCVLVSIPRNHIFRPSEAKIKSAKKIDYLGNSKVIADIHQDQAVLSGSVGFNIVPMKTNQSSNQSTARNGPPPPPPPEPLGISSQQRSGGPPPPRKFDRDYKRNQAYAAQQSDQRDNYDMISRNATSNKFANQQQQQQQQNPAVRRLMDQHEYPSQQYQQPPPQLHKQPSHHALHDYGQIDQLEDDGDNNHQAPPLILSQSHLPSLDRESGSGSSGSGSGSHSHHRFLSAGNFNDGNAPAARRQPSRESPLGTNNTIGSGNSGGHSGDYFGKMHGSADGSFDSTVTGMMQEMNLKKAATYNKLTQLQQQQHQQHLQRNQDTWSTGSSGSSNMSRSISASTTSTVVSQNPHFQHPQPQRQPSQQHLTHSRSNTLPNDVIAARSRSSGNGPPLGATSPQSYGASQLQHQPGYINHHHHVQHQHQHQHQPFPMHRESGASAMSGMSGLSGISGFSNSMGGGGVVGGGNSQIGSGMAVAANVANSSMNITKEIPKMRVKVHYGNDVFVILVDHSIFYDQLAIRIYDKIVAQLRSSQLGKESSSSPRSASATQHYNLERSGSLNGINASSPYGLDGTQQQPAGSGVLSRAASVSSNLAPAHTPPLSSLKLKYRDEDQELVLMTDNEDFELAKVYAGAEMSAESGLHLTERLELWAFFL